MFIAKVPCFMAPIKYKVELDLKIYRAKPNKVKKTISKKIKNSLAPDIPL